ncbi:ABC transporter permease subunit [Gordonia pseudamarae]|jgi:peptide/nickel transport system permease protein|uniref:ABC transporter permease subunit n=1 Tax=Gordonia pseudamarae TaxID=2831662 RepID=A0ABX6IC88_9ACTN|nr:MULTISPECIES: ABC transporter permease subunit [Gordonia]MBD0024369.1 ABC transporter permease subunit [Gordonia sp. (in: high G+C Gram-positive bacteria)]QHN24663.1 ABC transporter permease subunit [Gordonia pseudamarae]QHN33593.1 ABC transporter permease subunit [Gordonia pseudamarae]
MRAAGSVVTAAVAAIGLLVLVAALPWLRDEDPAQAALRVRFHARGDDPEAVEALRRQLDLPADPWSGVWRWLSSAVGGDFGESWSSGRPVTEIVGPALLRSATLSGSALVVAVLVVTTLLAYPVWRATADSGPFSARLGALCGTLAALPEVILAITGVAVFAVGWQLLPAIGWGSPHHLVLPALALGIPAGGLLARIVTATAEQALAEPWVTTWRANHIGRPAITGAVARRVVAVGAPQAVVVAVTVFGSSVAVEKVFAIRGAGTLAVNSVLSQDLPVLQTCLAAFIGAGLACAAGAAMLHGILLRPALSAEATGTAVTAAPPSTAIAPVTLAAVAMVVIAGLFRDGDSTDLDLRLQAPSLRHPLGTDAVGHDLLGRVSAGTVRTVGLALIITFAALLVALAIGLLVRSARAGAVDVFNTVPSTVAGIILAAILGQSLFSACIAVLAVAWIPLAVHARTLAVTARAAGYVEAAALAGVGPVAVTVTHVLPAIAGPLLRHALVRVPATALGIAGLSFIGLGADVDNAELGAMLTGGLDYLTTEPWVVAAPGGVIVALGLAAGTVRVATR